MDLKQRRKKESEEEDDDALAQASKDPLVRSPPKAPKDSQIDEDWDLEDDEDWVGPREEKTMEVARKRRVLKRDNVEVGIAFIIHLVVMAVYIYIHVYDATIFKRNKGKGFDGAFTYGGRWKYLTYCNLVRSLIMFSMA